MKSHQNCQNMTDDPALDMGVEVEIKGENNDEHHLTDFN